MSSETDAAGDESGSPSETYVHDPAAFDAEGQRVEDGAARSGDPTHPDDADREFDWRGWTLVGVVFFSFVVAPIVVYLRPPQLPYYATLIAFPLLPALILGAAAVWATTRP